MGDFDTNNCEKKISLDLRGEYAFLKNHQNRSRINFNNRPLTGIPGTAAQEPKEPKEPASASKY